MLLKDSLLQSERSHLQSLWAESVLFHKVASLEAVKRESVGDPIEAVLFCLLSEEQQDFHLESLALSRLSLGELCQFALLYGMMDFSSGKEFAKKLLAFSYFPAFRSLEKVYDDVSAKLSISLLQRAFGKKEALSDDLDLYFAALCQNLPCFEATWQEPVLLESEIFDDVLFSQEKKITGALPVSSSFVKAAFVTEGEGMPLGALTVKDIEIVAFGPQGSSLNQPELFGMDRVIASRKWGRVHAQKDVWFESESDFAKGYLEVGFYGCTSSLFFVFYIRADQVVIDSKSYAPKSLERYKGKVHPVVLHRKKTQIQIEGIGTSTMHLIPLAGEGCFWGADFLLAFGIQEKLRFHFEGIVDYTENDSRIGF